MSAEFRLDDLARRAGVASTTVRLYQSKGLLAPPRLEGRTGWYNESHLSRLRLIARLQAEGHSLAGIRNLLVEWEQGRSLDAVVGVETELDALLGDVHAVVEDGGAAAGLGGVPAVVVEDVPLEQDAVDAAEEDALGVGLGVAVGVGDDGPPDGDVRDRNGRPGRATGHLVRNGPRGSW